MQAAAGEVATKGVEAAASILPSKLNLNPMGQISPTVIVAVIVIVVGMYFALRKVYVSPYLDVIEARERIFETADAQCAEAAQCIDAANVGSEQAMAEAVAEAEAMRAEARGRAEEYRSSRLAAVTGSAAAALEVGRAQIVAARSGELARLRAQAEECVHIACGQLVGNVDDDLVAATVERLMARQAN